MDFKKLESVCRNNGITEVEIHQIKENGTSVSTFNGEVDANEVYFKNEMFVRGVYNNHITSLYIERDTDDEIDNIVKSLVANASVTESHDPYYIYKGDEKYPALVNKENDYASYNQADYIELCKKIEDFLRSKSDLITNTSVSIEVGSEEVSIVNSNGLSVSRANEYAYLSASIVVNKDGKSLNNYYGKYIDKFSEIDYKEMEERLVKRTISSLGAESIESGSYPVVFEAPMAASLISCFMSMFYADNITKKLSLLCNKMNEKVFGNNVTITDDPFCKESHHQYSFDDEGVGTSVTKLVDGGVLTNYLTSLSTSKMLDLKPTGNGFKNGSGKVCVAPTNLCIKCGNKSFDEMISSIKNGVLITKMMGQHAGVNPVSGSFNLQSSGFLIKDGKIDKPVTLIIVSGNIIDTLNNIVDISSDFDVYGKVGTGSIYVNSLAISGK